MRQLEIKIVRPKLRKGLAVVKLTGFLNASTLADFEDAMDTLLLEKRLDVLLDFDNVKYINSSGIGALVNYHNAWRDKGDDLALIKVHRGVAIVMHQLGLTNLVPILRDEREGLEYLRRTVTGQKVYPTYEAYLAKNKRVPGGQRKSVSLPIARTQAVPAGGDGLGTVLVIEPRKDLFTDVLQLRLNGKRNRFHVVHDCTEALKRFDELQPDLVILRDTVPQAEPFLAKIKIEKGRSMVSVIKVYPSGTDIKRFRNFKIWENDYFIEPFDIGELFALADMELKRVPRDRRQILHQSRIQFLSTEENIEKGLKLMEHLIRRAGLNEEDASSMFAAFREGVDNAMRHGHQFNPNKAVDVTFTVDEERVMINIVDEGPGFPYRRYLEELRDEEAYVRARKMKAAGKKGGLGILLMYKCSDTLEYAGKGNVLRMEKTKRHAAPEPKSRTAAPRKKKARTK